MTPISAMTLLVFLLIDFKVILKAFLTEANLSFPVIRQNMHAITHSSNDSVLYIASIFNDLYFQSSILCSFIFTALRCSTISIELVWFPV